MPQSPHTTNRPDAREGRARRLGLLLLLVALAVCVAAAAGAGAQSGRRKTAPLSPVPTPTPAPEPVGESESESRPRRQDSNVGTQVSLIVYQLDGTFGHVDFMVQDAVMGGFMERLRRSKDLSASRADKRITRKEAQDIAKAERASHVVLVELEDDIAVGGSRTGGVGQTDTRALAIKTYVYEPVTGTLKFVDHTSQRPYRQGTSIGGIRLPIPAPRTRIERFPNELQLEQAARDAADRIMQRFNLRPPPDN